MAKRLSLSHPGSASMTPSAEPDRAWDALTDRQRAVAADWLAIVRAVAKLQRDTGLARRAACEHLAEQLAHARAPENLLQAGARVGRGGMPSWSSMNRQCKAHDKHGPVGLAPKHKGSARKNHGWEVRAERLWLAPEQPSMGTVAYWLREEGHASATNARVCAYLRTIPADKGVLGPKRLGVHYVDQNVRPYVVRDYSDIPVGAVYEGDGHTCDVYVQHPNTGKPFRPELTWWIDWRSQYKVGWHLSEAESATSTLYSLGRAVAEHDHVPMAVHVDPGSGFVNKLIDNEVAGFMQKLAIESMKARPGNAKGKGLVEGSFRWFEERCGKRWHTYCGHDRSDDYLRHLTEKVKRGLIVLPTLAQYADSIERYIDTDRATPRDSLDGRTPGSLWATLERTPLHMPIEDLIAVRVERTVRRRRVELWNRTYGGPELGQWDGERVLVCANLRDMGLVKIRDLKGRWLCDASRVDATPALSDDRLAELQQKRLAGQRARLQHKLDEAEARAGLAVTADDVLEDMTALGEPQRAEPLEQGEDDALLARIQLAGEQSPIAADEDRPEIDIDLLDTSYNNNGRHPDESE